MTILESSQPRFGKQELFLPDDDQNRHPGTILSKIVYTGANGLLRTKSSSLLTENNTTHNISQFKAIAFNFGPIKMLRLHGT